MDEAQKRTSPPAPDGWPVLPEEKAITFGTDPSPKDLRPGTKLYRVIDDDSGRSGSFWNTTAPLAQKRSGETLRQYLMTGMETAGMSLTLSPNQGLKGWVGAIAPQESKSVLGFVLPGGDTQVWVPYGTITPDGVPLPTPWNHP